MANGGYELGVAPAATYRVQLEPNFGFEDLAAVVPYLKELGITHVYCSPYLQSMPASTHGYDVVDHTSINSELGGPEGHSRMCDALSANGMSHILDVVPNHMAIGGRASKWWWDVMKNGPQSPYARFFDVDWDPLEPRLKNKILVPILADQYGRVLESGGLSLRREGDEVLIRYRDHEVPVAPGSIESLPGAPADRGDAIEFINSEPALLHALLEQQHYRLAFWHTDLELNYRRFFDINELVALRMEEPGVFDLVHSVPLALIEQGRLAGVRIDHVDGLRDPKRYLERLRGATGAHAFLIVEKILGPMEQLPDDWPVQGTTGYDFLGLAGGLAIHPAGEKAITEFYVSFTAEIAELDEIVRAKKLQIMEEILPSDVERLVSLLIEICERHPRHRDYTRNELRVALREVIAALDVYRTYVDAEERTVTPVDAHRIQDAVKTAEGRRRDIDLNLFGFLSDLLMLQYEGISEADFVMRLQQTTGPIMAKSVEDTAFYIYNRFVALNEVGCSPGVWGTPVEDFHAAMARAAERWPQSLLATSTHDTKRSEDVRARLALLSEIPGEWEEAVRRWARLNDRHRRGPLPDRNAEYLLYQTLVGAHPLGAHRAVAYMQKAAREAKRFTSWTAPDEAYETALEDFVRGALEDEEFISDLDLFVQPLVDPGRINSLTQTLLKLTCPGVPDIYQGCEVWNLSLVDPDNRRGVDYSAKRNLLVRCTTAEEAMGLWDEGGPKIFLIERALGLGRGVGGARYEPLVAEGPGEDHVIAFTRSGTLAAVAPRLVLGRPAGWEDTRVNLPEGNWFNALTDQWVADPPVLGLLWEAFPVALLVREQ